jgi:hypothetical protein
MDEKFAEFDERLSGEYSALRDTPAVMRSATEYLQELHGVVTRLGDAIEQSGLPGRLWRADEADLATLGDAFPSITVDELMTRLAQFATERGPNWLRGDEADLADFRAEARILYDIVHSLRVLAQRLRMTGAGTKSDLALERAFGNARVATPLDRVAILLETLDALGPFMAPIPPDAWGARQNAGMAQDAGAFGAAAMIDPMDSQERRRLRDYAPSQDAAGEAPRAPKRTAGRRFRWNPALLLRNRLALAVAGVVIVGALAATLLVRYPFSFAAKKAPTATPLPALVAAPAALTLPCSTRRTVAMTLTNQSGAPVTWQAKAPTTVALTPAQGTIPAGQSATLQARLTSARATTGAITVTFGQASFAVPYTATC